MQGVPGSGKTTIAGRLVGMGAVSVSADHYMLNEQGVYEFDYRKLPLAHQSCKVGFVNAINEKAGLVIVDNTNTSLIEMAFYVDFADTMDYTVDIVTILMNPMKAHGCNRHGVSLLKVMQMDMQLRETLQTMPPWWRNRHIIEGGTPHSSGDCARALGM
jgi:hypothetical protein